ncbi:MAG: hypothetical protein IJ736_07630 [Firmicutes bacterium]|nr:hypothetical protein [Bacillota bacterium]
MTQKYIIPVNYKSGKYSLSELPSDHTDALVLYLQEMEVLTYFTPDSKKEVTLYGITEDILKNSLSAYYDNEGQLEYIKIIQDDKEKLVYINLPDTAAAKNKILNFSKHNADLISEKILNRREKIARIFIERYYDGDTVDIAAKIGTANDMKNILEEYGDMSAANNSGDYPLANRIECDSDTLGIILSCSPSENRYELLDLAVNTIADCIKERVLKSIEKTDDFKFITEDYD